MSKIQIGVIGGGISDRRMIPQGIIPSKNAELFAIWDIDKATTERLADKYKVSAAESIEALLGTVNMDAVYIASPNQFHAEQAIQAAKAGIHVLVEKPLALTVAEARKMIRTVERKGVKAMEDYMMPFHTLNMEITEIVLRGNIGDVVSGRAQLTCWYPPIQGAWRQNPALSGGGALMDMATHMYDAIEKITGQRIVEVFANAKTLTHSYKSDDSSTTMLILKNGATFTVDCYYNIPDAAAKNRLEIYGTKGSILAEGTLGQSNLGKVEVIISDQGAYDAKQDRPLEVATKKLAANTN